MSKEITIYSQKIGKSGYKHKDNFGIWIDSTTVDPDLFLMLSDSLLRKSNIFNELLQHDFVKYPDETLPRLIYMSNLYWNTAMISRSKGYGLQSGGGFTPKPEPDKILWSIKFKLDGSLSDQINSLQRMLTLSDIIYKTELKVSRWPGGDHYYAKFGSEDICVGDTYKFSSREMIEQSSIDWFKNILLESINMSDSEYTKLIKRLKDK